MSDGEEVTKELSCLCVVLRSRLSFALWNVPEKPPNAQRKGRRVARCPPLHRVYEEEVTRTCYPFVVPRGRKVLSSSVDFLLPGEAFGRRNSGGSDSYGVVILARPGFRHHL